MAVVRFVGGGIYPQRDLTLGGLEILRGARVVLHTNFPHAKEWLRSIGVRDSRDLSSLYELGGNDRSNYSSMLSAILEAADNEGYAAYLVAGHPWLGVSTTQEVFKLANSPGSQVSAASTPGVSSFDTVINDLSIDPLERGCLVVDSNRLLLFRFPLDPRLGLMIYHASAVGTSTTNFARPWEDNQIELLQTYLVEQLGAERSFIAVRSQSSEEHERSMIHGTVGSLVERVREFDYGTTLYVPPGRPSGIDRAYLAQLMPAGEREV